MPNSLATISWTFVPGSLSTLVEYKPSGTTMWTQPTSPMNPTVGNTYPLILTDNVQYDIRLTTNGIACAPKSMTITTTNVVNNCCPDGYTLSEDGTYCFQTNTTAATPPSSPENTVSATDANYSVDGTWIYSPGYDVNGTGVSSQISTSNPFWINLPDNTTNGPMNRTGLWATTTTSDQIVGFTVCITAPTNSTYYVGLGCDNYAIVNIDGNNVITQDPVALAAQYNALYPGIGAFVTFRLWHVYPVILSQGNHVLELIGYNVSSGAALGAEVYSLNAAALQAVTSYSDMGAGLIFSTKDYIGQPVQVGSGGTGYSCPDGYSLVLCEGPAYCTQTFTSPTQPCTTTSTTTTTTSTMPGEGSGIFVLDNDSVGICFKSTQPLYYMLPYGTGTAMFHDVDLTIPATGSSFIVMIPGGELYNIDPATGILGSSAGDTC